MRLVRIRSPHASSSKELPILKVDFEAAPQLPSPVSHVFRPEHLHAVPTLQSSLDPNYRSEDLIPPSSFFAPTASGNVAVLIVLTKDPT